jgi:nitrite reductase (NADH) large subunit
VNAAIVVDDQLRTSDPAIYAVGECVQHRGQLYGLVAPLWEQAQILAQHLTGLRPEAAYRGSKTSSRLKVMGLEVASMGLIEAELESDEVVLFHEPKRGVYKKLIIRDDRLVGAISLGDPLRAPLLMQLFDRSTPLPQERAALLFDLGGAPAAVSPEAMTDDAPVCHCNGVTKGDLRECIAGGGCSLQAVMRATRAGTGCGSCKGLVRVLEERLRPAGASETSAAAETSASDDIPMGVLR